MPTQLQGATAARKAIRKFEPTLSKELTKELAAAIKPVIKQGRGFMPSNADMPSGWLKRDNAKGKWSVRYYNQSEARRGIVGRTSPSKPNRSGFRSLVSIVNIDIGGAIYETAGRKSGITGNFTSKLGGMLVGFKRAMTGRAMFRAYDANQGKAKAAAIAAIEKSAKEFNRIAESKK